MPNVDNVSDSLIGASENELLRQLATNMMDGFAYHKIVLDDSGKPVDYIFLEVNEAFERLTGLKRKNILGKPVTEALPGIENDPADWIGVYGRVALTGEPTKFENYNQALGKWFLVSSYSPKQGYFVATFEDITERHKLEDSLKATEERFRFALQNTPVIVGNLDLNLRFTWAYNLQSGYTVEALIGREFGYGMKFENTDTVLACFRKVIEQDKPKRCEIEGWGPSGERVFDFYIEPRKDENGEIIGVSFTALNITDLRKTEKELRKSEQRWATTLASIGDAVIATDISGNVTFMNVVAEELTGWNLSEALQKSANEVFRIVNEKTHSKVENPVTKVLEKGVIVGLANHTILLRRDGSEVPIDDSGAPIKGKDGKITGVVLVFRDITERKKVEEILLKAKEQTELDRKRLESILETTPSAIVILEAPDGKISYVNKRAMKLYGFDTVGLDLDANVEKVKAKRIDGSPIPTEEVPAGRSLWSGEEVHNEELIIERPDGMQLPVLVSSAPLFDSKGKIIAAIVIFEDITEKKKIEQELWQAKNDWERTFDTVPDLIAILDNNHRIVRANRAMAEKLGVKPEQALGLPCYAYVHGTDCPPIFCPHAKTLQDGKQHVAEVHESRLGGYFIVSTTPLKDDQGRLIGSVHVARDITERKQNEEKLNRLNRTLRAISNSNQALMHASDEVTFLQEGCRILVEDCGYTMVWIGFARDDEAKSVEPVAYAGFDKSYLDSLKITWADTERGHGPTGRAIRTGRPQFCENMKTDPRQSPWRKEALRRGYSSSIVLPLKSGDKTFGAITMYSEEPRICSDDELKLLTELANDFAYGIAMLRLRKERAQAEEQLNKQAALIDLSPDAIIMRRLDGTISFWSKGAEKLYGWIKEEVIGRNINAILQTVLSESLDSIVSKLKEEGHWSGELMHRAKNGQEIVLQSYWLARFDENGSVSELMESNVDITDRKQMQLKLEEYAAHLEELVQERTRQLKDAERLTAIGETAGMVGHDLRNPLQTITGETFLAKEELNQIPDSPGKRSLEESINIIAEQTEYMDKIVSDLQDFVRPISPDKKPVDLQKLLAVTLNRISLPENINAQIIIGKNMPDVSADSQLLKRVFFNLFTNAVQAMPNGGMLTIRAQAKKYSKGNGKIAIQVEDTGTGIPEKIKPKIFRPLFTTKAKGQGFGLAVCRRVIEAHGGTITFESEEGKGTRFIVELPT